MKRLSVAKKLILGFLIATALCAYVGIAGIDGMSQINDACSSLYDEQTKPLPDIAKTIEHLQLLRVHARNALIYSKDTERMKTIEQDTLACMNAFEAHMADYGVTIKDEESRKAFDDASNQYHTYLKPRLLKFLEDALSGLSQDLLLSELDVLRPTMESMISSFTLCMNNKVLGGMAADASSDELYLKVLTKIIISIVVSIAVALLLAFYISHMISYPISMVSKFLNRFGTLGDFDMSEEDHKCYEKRGRDEIGVCQESLYMVIQRLRAIGNVLHKVETGDLGTSLEPLSEKDSLGLAINKVLDGLNAMFGELHTASSEVSLGSAQVSKSAQDLAAGSSEQAATIEELTASITEMRLHTDHNAESASKARDASEKSISQLNDSMHSMDEMMNAMTSIDESSGNITKVIKVIDDIAFQTNILALNAAVEAARAGQHGKGFAVVAEEVRNLASKSATAAKETAILIDGSRERVKEGNEIVSQTKANLETVGEYTRGLSQLVNEVAVASMEQAKSIGEINQGLEQFSLVVQANSSTAESSAAASEEMSAQAVLLDEIVARFKLKRDSENRFSSI